MSCCRVIFNVNLPSVQLEFDKSMKLNLSITHFELGVEEPNPNGRQLLHVFFFASLFQFWPKATLIRESLSES